MPLDATGTRFAGEELHTTKWLEEGCGTSPENFHLLGMRSSFPKLHCASASGQGLSVALGPFWTGSSLRVEFQILQPLNTNLLAGQQVGECMLTGRRRHMPTTRHFAVTADHTHTRRAPSKWSDRYADSICLRSKIVSRQTFSNLPSSRNGRTDTTRRRPFISTICASATKPAFWFSTRISLLAFLGPTPEATPNHLHGFTLSLYEPKHRALASYRTGRNSDMFGPSFKGRLSSRRWKLCFQPPTDSNSLSTTVQPPINSNGIALLEVAIRGMLPPIGPVASAGLRLVRETPSATSVSPHTLSRQRILPRERASTYQTCFEPSLPPTPATIVVGLNMGGGEFGRTLATTLAHCCFGLTHAN
ncbi:uncharacterized protein CLUP02_15036 [Colletotrichum lupini]|uniref:Uncharacterized protein n=1 Tax=Colletotrichum lupini TaxID=145971 RepID=A0A9Q8T5Q9_9PEZI|nr:uncharacterized protein CLUP02_15036 [Colletotrichum lupini]UQC89505.1 hypothetical protein CLUP02_15036 [Colletotrichum lupini]